jgi:hypothetical protein
MSADEKLNARASNNQVEADRAIRFLALAAGVYSAVAGAF